MIIPQIHLNGTSKTELLTQAHEADLSLIRAIDALEKMAPNGRDYYLTGNLREAEAEHKARLDALRRVRDEILTIGEGIADQQRSHPLDR